MAGNYIAIKAAIKTALQGIDGSPTYTLDLSATDAVSEDRFSREATTLLPRAYLTPAEPAIQYRASTDYNDLGTYGAVATFDLVVVVAPADRSNGARVRAAEIAMNDLVSALSADRDLGSTALDIEMSLNVIQGAELASSPYGIVYATLSVIFHRVG